MWIPQKKIRNKCFKFCLRRLRNHANQMKQINKVLCCFVKSFSFDHWFWKWSSSIQSRIQIGHNSSFADFLFVQQKLILHMNQYLWRHSSCSSAMIWYNQLPHIKSIWNLENQEVKIMSAICKFVIQLNDSLVDISMLNIFVFDVKHYFIRGGTEFLYVEKCKRANI